MRRMRWFKVVAIAAGILIAFLVVGTVIGFVIHAVTDLVIAALVVGAIAVGIKMARSRKQVSGKRRDREVRDSDRDEYSRPLPRAEVEHVATAYPPAPRPGQAPPRSAPAGPDVDDELARLKREMGR
jgi:hypothetical protein